MFVCVCIVTTIKWEYSESSPFEGKMVGGTTKKALHALTKRIDTVVVLQSKHFLELEP